MATPFEDTPKWFDANYYLDQKVAQMQVADPAGNWTRDAVIKNFADAGIDNPYDHYKAFGDVENLSPNALFNNTEYLAAKTAMMGSTYTVEMVAKAIHDAGLTLMEHYLQYGSKYENLSPSSDFNQDKYYDAKLQEHIAAEPDKGWTLDMVKADFAAAGITPLEHFLTYGAIEGLVDKYDFSVNGTPIPHPGNTKIVLTTGVDTVAPDATAAEFKSSDRDDIISALVTSPSKSTLNPDDVIDGGAGLDTLVLDMQSSFTSGFAKGGVKNVEQIELNNAAGRVFNAKGVEAANVYMVDGGDKGGVKITNVDTTATGYALKMAKGDFTAQIADAAVKGKADVVNVTLNSVGTEATDTAAAARVNITVKGMTTSGVEGLNLIAQGKDSFVTLKEGHETVSVSGTGNLDVVTAGGLKTFNASNADGKVTADLSASKASLKSILGGDADDSITVGAPAAAVEFAGGTGNDTLTFSEAVAVTSKHVISGFEKIVLEDNSTLNGTNITDVAEIVVKAHGTSTFSKFDNTELALSINASGGASVVAATAINYDGKGSLTAQLVDLAAAGSGVQTLTTLTADNVETLNLVNTDADSTFTIGTLNAKSATEITVDTGEGDVAIGAGVLSALTKIDVTGEGTFTIAGAGFKALESLDASDLKDTLTVTLNTGMTQTALDKNGLTITGATNAINVVNGSAYDEKLFFYGGYEANTVSGGAGDDNITVYGDSNTTITIIGGEGADVITLSDGNDIVKYAGSDDFGGADEHIFGFNDGGSDVIQFALALGGVSASVANAYTDVALDGTVSAGKVNGFEVDFSDGAFGYEASDVTAALDGVTGFASSASDAKTILAVSDGTNTYLWYYTELASAATAAGAGEIDSDEITLIGVIDGQTDFAADDFAFKA